MPKRWRTKREAEAAFEAIRSAIKMAAETSLKSNARPELRAELEAWQRGEREHEEGVYDPLEDMAQPSLRARKAAKAPRRKSEDKRRKVLELWNSEKQHNPRITRNQFANRYARTLCFSPRRITQILTKSLKVGN